MDPTVSGWYVWKGGVTVRERAMELDSNRRPPAPQASWGGLGKCWFRVICGLKKPWAQFWAHPCDLGASLRA